MRTDTGRYKPCINDLIELGRRDVIVNTYLKLWFNGDVTFEQMTIYLIIEFRARNENLEKHMKLDLLKSTKPLVVEKPNG